MKIVIYADESGTHDETGSKIGSKEATIIGIAAPAEDWSRFRAKWQSILDEFQAPHFHFREWSDASDVARGRREANSSYLKNVYRGWTEPRLNGLLLKLADLVGSGSNVLVGAFVETKKFHLAKLTGDISIGANPYERCAVDFFASCIATISQQRRPWKRQPISFVFEQSTRDLEAAVLRQFQVFKTHYSTFRELAFGEKNTMPHVPLQAADMVAWRIRKITAKFVANDPSGSWPELDERLFRNEYAFIRSHRLNSLNDYLQCMEARRRRNER